MCEYLGSFVKRTIMGSILVKNRVGLVFYFRYTAFVIQAILRFGALSERGVRRPLLLFPVGVGLVSYALDVVSDG